MNAKRILCLLLCLVLFPILTGCLRNESSMPFNGEITFHSIRLTIPSEYVRDSTQSNADTWLFEQGWYKKTIIIMHRQHSYDPSEYISTYAEGLQGQGIQSELTTFMGAPAAMSSATKENGVFWQELSFAMDGVFYAIALNGGTETEFQALLDSLSILS